MRIINFEWSSVIEFYYINKNQEQGTRSRPGFVAIYWLFFLADA